jgi:hypothetical protein
MAISIMISDFLKNISVGGGLVALQIFWSLKKGTRTFNFLSNEPSRDILRPLDRHDHPWKKNNKKRIRDLSSGKKCKIPHFFHVGT